MSLADALSAQMAAAPVPARRSSAPSGFEPGIRYEAGKPAEVVTDAIVGAQVDPSRWADLIADLGFTLPDGYSAELVEARYDPVAWTRSAPGEAATTKPAWRYKFRIDATAAAQSAASDLTHLVKIARGNRNRPARKVGTGRTRVVVVSDLQIGKVDSRGGSRELLERIESILGQLAAVSKVLPCDDVVILDPGDLVEGFENTSSQAFTNDLSFPAQLDLANVVLTEIVSAVAAGHSTTRVATVPSNHAAWRRGKGSLGKPSDDFGLLTHRTVARALAYRDDISFVIPDEWSESLALQVRGAVVGLAHGHQASSPNGVPAWWAKQTHGGGPLAAATIAITGHYHHLRVEPSGAIDGKARWWMQAPTLDNGSSWWANGGGGSDCEPGLLTFTIDDSGAWDNLRLITAQEAA